MVHGIIGIVLPELILLLGKPRRHRDDVNRDLALRVPPVDDTALGD